VVPHLRVGVRALEKAGYRGWALTCLCDSHHEDGGHAVARLAAEVERAQLLHVGGCVLAAVCAGAPNPEEQVGPVPPGRSETTRLQFPAHASLLEALPRSRLGDSLVRLPAALV
jgi:hypothetical protein